MGTATNPFWKGYQRSFLADLSTYVAVLKARRIGFSEAVACKCAMRALGLALVNGKLTQTKRRGVKQNLFSASHVQAQDLLQRVLKWVRILGRLAFKADCVLSETVTLAVVRGGVKLRAMSSSPKAARGWEGDVVLDEFASVVNQKELWAAVEPLAKPTLGNREGYLITVISTPLGDDNLFFEMVQGSLAHKFSQHRVTLLDANAAGFPVYVSDGAGGLVEGTVDQLRSEFGDEQVFDQEFMCECLAANMRFIDADTYDAASYDFEWVTALADQDFGGLDLARKRDRTAFARLTERDGELWHRGTDIIHNAKWSEQEVWWDARIATCRKVAVDSSSIGSKPSEDMVDMWGASRILPVDFTITSKERLASGLKQSLEKRTMHPLKSDVDTRRAVLSMRREQLPGGGVRYSMPRTAAGHGDEGWAIALAVDAADSGAVTVPYVTVHDPLRRRGPMPRVPLSTRRGIYLA